MRVHRLVRILMKIEQEGKVKAQEMAEALEVSSRTIYRDIDVLCEAGYPIITTTGQNGGITFVEGYKLNLDQTDAILKTLVTHLYTMPEQEKFLHALENGMNFKYINKTGLSYENKQKIIIDKKSWWEEASAEIDLQPIMKGLFLQQKLKIEYTQTNGIISDRIIAPYGMVLKYTSWYVIGYCYFRNEIRTFRCSRIKNVTLLREAFEIPDNFELKSYWNLSVNTFKESRRASEYYPVEIKLPEAFWPVLEKYDVIGVNRVGDSLIVKIDLHRRDVAEEEIRALLCYSQILYPEEMIVRAREILARSIQMYDTLSE